MNTTVPDRVGWVPEPTGRGTAGLLYNCLFTMFLSSWTILHPSVGNNEWSAFWNKVYVCVGSVFAPEVITTHALDDWKFASVIQSALPLEESVEAESPQFISMTKCFFLQMNGFVIRTSDGEIQTGVIKSYRDCQHASQLMTASEVSLATISEKEIWDRSKADGVVKTIVSLQVTWFFLQVIGRLSQRLPVSPLELFTIQNMCCALVSSIAWWSKPKDVKCTIELVSKLNKKEIEERMRRETRLTFSLSTRTLFFEGACIIFLTLLAMTPLGFWNFSFPSRIEEVIWKVFSVTASLLALFGIIYFFMSLWKSSKFLDTLYLVLVVLYGIVRFVFLVEVLYELRSTPRQVYDTVNWSLYMPHW